MAQVTELHEPQTIKISSKRQITIPAQWYREKHFDDYAILEWKEDGLLIRPLEVDREDVTVSILRTLVDDGYSGDELIEKYIELKGKVTPIEKLVLEAEADIAEGNVVSFDDVLAEGDRVIGEYEKEDGGHDL